jgi:hypothetical protein
MMGEPVEQGAGEPFGAEYGSPFIERQVAGDQRGATFIALAERLEEQLGADSRERHIAQLVDDQPSSAGAFFFPAAVDRLERSIGGRALAVTANRNPATLSCLRTPVL